MDYCTKATSREELRRIADYFHRYMHFSRTRKIPVVEMLDYFCNQFDVPVSYDVVKDNELPPNIPAQTILEEDGSFQIIIKEKVYIGAKDKEIGGYRNHIMHEMCHVLLFCLGFTPVMSRSFDNNEIPAFCSAEWQAKALCGEIMMPYNETRGMSAEEISRKYKVSMVSATERLKY